MALPTTFSTLNLSSYPKDGQNNYILPASLLDDNFTYVLNRLWVNTTAPTDTDKYPFWLDTSTSPNLFKLWNGSQWVLFRSKEFDYTACRVYRSGEQTISAGTYNKVQFNAESYDNGNNFDSITNYRYLVPSNGIYLVASNLYITSASNTSVNIYIRLDGITLASANLGSSNCSINIVDILSLNVNQYIEIVVYPGINAIINGAASMYSYLNIHRLS